MSHTNIIIEVYCLLITIILMICNFMSADKKNVSERSRIMFGMLAVNVFIIVIFIWLVIVDGNVRYEQANRVMTGICYALGAVLTELFGEYVFSVIKEENQISRWLPFSLRIVCGVAGALDLISIFNGMYFSTVNGYHIRGPFFIFNQIFVIIIMFFELLYILTRIKIIGRDAAALAMYSFFPFVSVILQIFVKDYVLMYPAITLSLFIIYVVTYINQANILNKKNIELTKAIEETEISKKEAEKANKAKSEFLSSMSHDIRTPLNAIIGMTGMAIDNIDNPKQALDNLSIVQASSRHLLSLVNDVLDLSMIENGKILIAQNKFILPDLLIELQKIAWPLARSKNLKFSVVADTVEHEFYIGDMQRLKQVLVNFISNSVKYTQSGGTITIKADEEKSDETGQAILKFSCIDNGIGIDKERQKVIFEPFVREVKSTVNPIEGTGLGLTIVRNIVSAMHGRVELVSERGKGSIFTAIIPLEIASEDEMLKQFEEVKDYHVLFVADGEEFCSQIRKNYPEIIGCPCDVMNSKDVLAKAKEPSDTYDAILIISEKNAPEIIQKLRDKYPDTDLIYGSNMQMIEDEDKILNAGADAVLYRPVFRSTLFEEYQTLHLKKCTVAGMDRYLSGKRILVAEDQPINYEVVQYILQNAGADVHRAENGKEAVEMFRTSKDGMYDLILMDIMMPLMNGYDATIAIRESDKSDALSILIVAMTANAFSEDVQRAYKCGMNGHISKPIEPAVMKETLIHLFSRTC